MGAFLWGDLNQDQWSTITRFIVHQRSRWIRRLHAPWSAGGTHPGLYRWQMSPKSDQFKLLLRTKRSLVQVFFQYYEGILCTVNVFILSLCRMWPSILPLQDTLSLTAASVSLYVLSPRCSLSVFMVLQQVSLSRPFLCLPLGARVSVALIFLSDY